MVAQSRDHAKLSRIQEDQLLQLRRFLLEARHPLSTTRRRDSGSRSRSEIVQGLRRLPGLVLGLRDNAEQRRSEQAARQDRGNRAAALSDGVAAATRFSTIAPRLIGQPPKSAQHPPRRRAETLFVVSVFTPLTSAVAEMVPSIELALKATSPRD